MWSKANAGKKAKDISYLLSNYWGRLLSTCGCWFFWDFGFYGNKIFQSEFIKILSPVRTMHVSLHTKSCRPLLGRISCSNP